ncbi:MAG: SLC13 family permease, partial [Planctomycetota bacterium]
RLLVAVAVRTRAKSCAAGDRIRARPDRRNHACLRSRRQDLPLAVFVGVYAVMLLGSVPGLRIDRTGAALLGAIVLIAGGSLSSNVAWQAIDIGTIGLLLGLMVVSAQFRLGGFYTRLTRWLAQRPTSPERLLFELVMTVGMLSALLTNDVVCLAIAPVLVDVCCQRGLDPVPFLLGLAAASNTGSAATLIGNPQNMLIGQALHLPFGGYLLDGIVPAGLGLLVVWAVLRRAYRGRFARELVVARPVDQPFLRWQSGKALVVLVLLVAGLLACPLAREVQALLAGGLLLLSRRMASREMLALVDWQLLVLFASSNRPADSACSRAAAAGSSSTFAPACRSRC